MVVLPENVGLRVLFVEYAELMNVRVHTSKHDYIVITSTAYLQRDISSQPLKLSSSAPESREVSCAELTLRIWYSNIEIMLGSWRGAVGYSGVYLIQA